MITDTLMITDLYVVIFSAFSKISQAFCGAVLEDNEYSQAAISRCNEALALFGAEEDSEAIQIMEETFFFVFFYTEKKQTK